MTYKYDVILKGGTVVDPVTKLNEIQDVGIKDGKIIEIKESINPCLAEESFELAGYYVMPGIVDLHVHSSAWLGGRYGHKMLAQAGVTSALDMSGPVDSVLDIARDYGVGINLACIEYVRPGHTVKVNDPDNEELSNLVDNCLNRGAIGIKLLGGHYPLTPDATQRAIEIANQKKAYVAFHGGTTENGSNIDGFLEAVRLANGNCLHMAHINSYCRGTKRDYMVETAEAIKALKENPNIRTEAYLSPLNGTSAKCSEGVPESLVTQRCLITGGFDATEEGLEEAIMDGWAQINMESGGKVVLVIGKEGIDYWRSEDTDTTVSFAVNPPEPRIRLATAKRDNGKFVVDCISTDGGGIPRNVIVEMGLALVKLQALSMEEFVQKASTNPAKILGLKNKGHFKIGSDADITVVDLEKQKPFMSMVNGNVIMYNGYVCGKGGQIITTSKGVKSVEDKGLSPLVVDLAESGFYSFD